MTVPTPPLPTPDSAAPAAAAPITSEAPAAKRESAASRAAPVHELRPKIRSAYTWSIAGTVTRHGFQFVVSILLARLLAPSDYGLIGMVTVFVGMLSIVQDLSIGRAVVHFDEPDEALPTYVTTATLFGALLTVLAYLSAPWVAAFYHEPLLVPIVRALSFTIVLSSLQSVGYGLLSKRFHFRALTAIDVGSSAAAGVIALAMAWLGYGVWSLVVNMVLFTGLQTVATCVLAPPRFTLRIRRDVLGRLLRYGLPLSGSALLYQFYDKADYLVVGKLAGATPFGWYTLAFRLATMAYEKISVIINRVAFPSFAAMQTDRDALRRHWYQVSRAISLVNFPVLAFLFVDAEDLLMVLVGQKWLPAAMPLRFLCGVGMLRGLVQLTQHIFSAVGATMVRLRLSIVSAVLLPVAFAVGCKLDGLAGVGIAWCVAYPVVFGYLLYETRKLVPFTLLGFLANLRSPLLTAAACGAAMLPARYLLAPGLLRFAACSALALAAFAACVLPARRKLFA